MENPIETIQELCRINASIAEKILKIKLTILEYSIEERERKIKELEEKLGYVK